MESLGASATVAIDDEEAIAALHQLDGVADTVGGHTAVRLPGKVRPGGRLGYASVLPDGTAEDAMVEISRVFAEPDSAKLRELVDEVRRGRFVLPISRRMPLDQARAAHELLEKGGGGKIVLTL